MADAIVYFSRHRWCPGGNARHDGLMEALAKYTRVVYAQPAVRAGASIGMPRPRVERVSETFWLLHDAFGVRFSRVGKRLGRAGAIVDSTWIRRALAGEGVRDYVFWSSFPEPRTHWCLPPGRFVYDCIDPCFTESCQAEMDAVEGHAAKKAHVVFATAESLLERMRDFGASPHLLPNGVREEDYHPSVLAGLPCPEALRNCRGPNVGFLGAVDWRFDAEVVTAAAKALPNFTFCIAGRVNADQEARVAELRHLPNTLFPGAISHEDGMAYTAHCDVAIIPFLPGPIGDAINPCKMYMYMMAGKPIVSTWTRECARHAPYVNAAGTAEQFTEAVRSAVSGDTPEQRAARTQFAMHNRWEDRAVAAIGILSRAGLLPPNRGNPDGRLEPAAELREPHR